MALHISGNRPALCQVVFESYWKGNVVLKDITFFSECLLHLCSIPLCSVEKKPQPFTWQALRGGSFSWLYFLTECSCLSSFTYIHHKEFVVAPRFSVCLYTLEFQLSSDDGVPPLPTPFLTLTQLKVWHNSPACLMHSRFPICSSVSQVQIYLAFRPARLGCNQFSIELWRLKTPVCTRHSTPTF